MIPGLAHHALAVPLYHTGSLHPLQQFPDILHCFEGSHFRLEWKSQTITEKPCAIKRNSRMKQNNDLCAPLPHL